MTHYTNVCGILSNGNETRVFVTASQGSNEIVSFPVANALQNHRYYEKIFTIESDLVEYLTAGQENQGIIGSRLANNFKKRTRCSF